MAEGELTYNGKFVCTDFLGRLVRVAQMGQAVSGVDCIYCVSKFFIISDTAKVS
jgi:hypothetical protein